MQVAPAAVISASRKQVMPGQPVGNEPIFGVERGDEGTRAKAPAVQRSYVPGWLPFI